VKNLSSRLEKEAGKLVKRMAGKTHEDAIDILSAALCDLIDSCMKAPESKAKLGMLVAMDIVATMNIYATADEFDEPYDQTLAKLKRAYSEIWGGRYLSPVPLEGIWQGLGDK